MTERTIETAPLLVVNAKVVLPEQVVDGSVAIAGGRIDGVWSDEIKPAEWLQRHSNAQVLDAAGKHVLPGLIDIHCDTIEKEVQPRPNTLFPIDMAFLEFERKLPLHGITTMYHSLSLGVGLSLRGDHLLTGMIDYIQGYNKRRSVIRNRIHLRYEVSYLAGLPIVERYIDEGMIHYLSLMDHSPGQGQYREPGSFERYVMKNQGVDSEEVKHIVAELQERRQQIQGGHLVELGRKAGAKGIAVASHDDDSAAKVEDSIKFGVSVSEFPINMETAKHATARGLEVCVGAPNVVRGGSHDYNLRASDAIKEDAASILCSDYHPSSLLHAIFKLEREGIAALPKAVRMASLHPARALGIDHELGSIQQGKAADIIIVDLFDELPWVTTAIVDGLVVYSTTARYPS